LVHEHLFDDALFKLFRDAELGDEFLESAQSLGYEPELGAKVNDAVWKIPLDPIDGARVWLFYTFDEENVYLLYIARFDARGREV
jgi:hypothetical protein